MSEILRSPTSAKVVAWLFIIVCTGYLVYEIIQLIQAKDDVQNPQFDKTLRTDAIINIVGFAVQILFSSLILVGLKRNSRWYLLPWLILNGLSAVGGCILAAYTLVLFDILLFLALALSTGLTITALFIVNSNFIRMGSVSRNP